MPTCAGMTRGHKHWQCMMKQTSRELFICNPYRGRVMHVPGHPLYEVADTVIETDKKRHKSAQKGLTIAATEKGYFMVELYSSSLSLAWLAAWSSAAFALEILPVINCSIAA